MNKIAFLTLALVIQIQVAKSQNVAINNDGSPPDSNAILDVKSTSKGVLLPRMTTVQRMNIQNPPEGLLIFDTDANTLFFTDTSGIGNNWNNVMNTDLTLPFSDGVSLPSTAFEIFNNLHDSTSIAGEFGAAEGTAVFGHADGIGGKFQSGGVGILSESSGIAGKFYGAGNGIGVLIDVNGNSKKALIVVDGLTGLGTMNPQAQLHVFTPGASGQTPLFRVTRKEENQPELGLTFQIEQQYVDMPEVANGNLGMMSNTRLNLMTNNDLLHPAISMHENKVGINKKDGTYPFSINGKTAFFENDAYVGEIFGHTLNGNLYLNAKTAPTITGNFGKNIILQSPIDNFSRAGFVGINNNSPQAVLDVQKGLQSNIPVANIGQSKFDNGPTKITSINGGIQDTIGMLYLNDDVTSDVYIANGGGDVYIPNINSHVSIGTSVNTHPLNVNGIIRSTELIIESGWADYVFDKNYLLNHIEDVEKHIEQYKRLPNMPSAEEIQRNGMKVAEISTKMMEKIEELTLYIISQQKEIKELKKEVELIKINQK